MLIRPEMKFYRKDVRDANHFYAAQLTEIEARENALKQ